MRREGEFSVSVGAGHPVYSALGDQSPGSQAFSLGLWVILSASLVLRFSDLDWIYHQNFLILQLVDTVAYLMGAVSLNKSLLVDILLVLFLRRTLINTDIQMLKAVSLGLLPFFSYGTEDAILLFSLGDHGGIGSSGDPTLAVMATMNKAKEHLWWCGCGNDQNLLMRCSELLGFLL